MCRAMPRIVHFFFAIIGQFVYFCMNLVVHWPLGLIIIKNSQLKREMKNAYAMKSTSITNLLNSV